MNRYAVYNGDDWLTDVEASSEAEALQKAENDGLPVTRVELVHTDREGR